jgi:type VI secretion system protein ImpA
MVRGLTHLCKDIRLIILLIRCRIPVVGIDALSEGIQAIIYLLHQWPEQLYPQCQDEGEYVPEYRQNALMGLDDDEGIIADIRQLTLQVSEIERLSISEIEQRISRDGSSIHALEKMLHANKHFLEQCWQAQAALEQLCCLPETVLGCGPLSCLKLERLLALFSQHPLSGLSAPDIASQVAEPSSTTESPSSFPVPSVDHLSYRTITLEQLRQMQSWFAFYEPSSPIQLILHFAEKSIGKDFHQIQQMYPSELIALLKINED